MNILHLTPNYFPSKGGLQTVFQSLSERLVKDYRDEVTVFTTNAVESVHSEKVQLLPTGWENVNGVQVHRFSFSRVFMPLLRFLLLLNHRIAIPGQGYIQLWRAGPVSPQMWWATRRATPDVILTAPFNYLHMYYPRRGRIPLVYIGALHLTEDEYIHPMIVRAINQASAYIAFTSYERDVLLRRGAKPEKLHVIGLGMDLHQFQHANGQIIRQKLGLTDEPIVAYLGRLASYKGVDTLILAMQKIWPTMPRARLLIAGAQSDFILTLQEIIDNLPVEWRERVIFMPQSFAVEDAPHLFAASDIFVTVSSAESFGIVYLEAWACRKPVIGGRIKAVASVIEDGRDGLLVECGNVDELANALLQLLQNPELCASMGQRGYEKVAKEHTWDIVTQKIRQVYQAVV